MLPTNERTKETGTITAQWTCCITERIVKTTNKQTKQRQQTQTPKRGEDTESYYSIFMSMGIGIGGSVPVLLLVVSDPDYGVVVRPFARSFVSIRSVMCVINRFSQKRKACRSKIFISRRRISVGKNERRRRRRVSCFYY